MLHFGVGFTVALILAFIDTLPLANSPEVFGLHPNAEIGYYTQATKEMWSLLIELQPQTGEYIKHQFVYVNKYRDTILKAHFFY